MTWHDRYIRNRTLLKFHCSRLDLIDVIILVLHFFLNHPQLGLQLAVRLLALVDPLLECLVCSVPVGDQHAAGGVQEVLDVTADLRGSRSGCLRLLSTKLKSATYCGESSTNLFLQLNFLQDSGSEPEASIFSTPDWRAMFLELFLEPIIIRFE